MNLWNDSTLEQRQTLIDAISRGDKDVVRSWITKHDKLEYGEMSIRRLRLEAAKKGIRNVTRKQKCELLMELTNVEDKRRQEERDSKIIGKDETITGLREHIKEPNSTRNNA